ncbi:MAG: type II toxin-antitoxin system VapC family toxin [Deltaproteobacteria bacterium]|nr:MAG: type II toxin-antitoxin system VapC family toxin [Deltaproteobacteria bacterium]
MIVPDVNLLVYAYDADMALHGPARKWWEELLSGTTPVGLCWSVMLGFVRLMTHPDVMENPLRPDTALSHVRQWLEQPCTEIIEPGPRHLDILSTILGHAGIAGNLTTDAHIAALAIEYRAELHSTDRDFGRFPGLRWRNPLGQRGSH